jgi:subtilisin-like proprotein convertase family protein
MRLAVTIICLVLCAGLAQADMQVATFTATPGLTIPDSPGGAGTLVTSTMEVDLDYFISDIRVYIDVSIIDWSSDLRIWVISAWDTQVELFFIGEGGEPASNPAGWYPTDFTPHEDMSQWVGEGGGGTWTIACQDWSQGGGDAVLNEWRVEITYDDSVATDAHTLTKVKALFD